MEHEKMDGWFRKQIQEDRRPILEEESAAKSRIWAALDIPRREPRILPIWKIAAAILLLLWVGTAFFYQQELQEQRAGFNQLNTELNQTKQELVLLKQQLQNLKQESEKQAIYASTKAMKTKENKVQIVEKQVTIRDTIVVEPPAEIQEKIRLVRDTIFIEKPVETSIQFVKSKKNSPQKTQKTKKERKPKKMQFVFGKPSLPKPQKSNAIRFLNEGQMAKKTKNNHGQLVIPIKN